MTKRIFELSRQDIMGMDAQKIGDAIRRSEGRTLMAEVCCGHQPLVDAVSNAETAAAFGADLITLNLFDMDYPFVWGLYPETSKPAPQAWLASRLEGLIKQMETGSSQVISDLKNITGRLIGVNLEPTLPDSGYHKGFCASAQNFERLLSLGFDYVVLTGNPKTGVTIENIARATKELRKICGNKIFIIAGKMHGAGGDNVYSLEELDQMAGAGADVVMVGAPGTLPGYSLDFVSTQIQRIHERGALAKTAVGTSQEGADQSTVREIALWSKMAGADIVHIGDAAYAGMALPENIMAMSIAIRGLRHTYRRMAYRK